MENMQNNSLTNHFELQLQLAQFAMEYASIEIFWLDRDARIAYANNHACKSLGYTKEEILQLSLKDFDPNYPVELWGTHWQDLKLNKTQSFETTHKRKDGSLYPVTVIANYVCYNGHEYNVGFSRDITERKIAELQKHESEQRYRSLFNNAEVAMFRSRLDGNETLDCNDKFLELVGRKREDVIGKPSVVLWEDPLKRLEIVRQLNSDGQITDYEFGMLTTKGELRHCVTSLKLFKDTGLLEGSIKDITLRKMAELSLRKSEEKFRTVFDSSTDMLMMLDENGLFDANKAALAGSGCATVEEFCLKSPAELAPPFQPDGTGSQLLAKQHIATAIEKGFHHFEWMNKRIDTGEVFPCEVTLTPMKQEDRQFLLVTTRDITQRKKAEKALLQSEASLRVMLENEVVGIVTSKDRVIQWANPAYEKLLGYEKGELKGIPSRIIFPDDEAFQNLGKNAYPVISTGDIFRSEINYIRKDGAIITVDLSGGLLNPQTGEILWSVVDISKRKQDEAKLAESENHLRTIINNEPECIKIIDAEGRLLQMNPAGLAMIEADSLELVAGNMVLNIVAPEYRQEFANMHKRVIAGESAQMEFEIIGLKGSRRWLDTHAVPMQDNNKTVLLGVTRDITERKDHEKQLEHIAHYDALTNLPNRVLLADRLQQGITQALRRNKLLAVAYIDLDGFKAVNDNHGHDAGDQLLVTLATRMKQALRDGDTLARLGGDEFVAVLIDLDNIEASEPLLNRLLQAAAQQVQVGDLMLQVSASLGVTIFPQVENVDADQLLRQADQAMYQAKLSGKNRYHVFDAEQYNSIRGHNESLEHIRRGMISHEFVLYYQPKVNLLTGKIIGAEALIRWQHPEKGMLPPAVFLPVIEDHPLAIEIGEWVIDTALTQMEIWHAAGLDIPVSINVGSRQIQQPDFVERLRDLLNKHPEIKPGLIELEILETTALEDVVRISQVIETCRKMGMKFALDDFGTGYSSLTYLKRLPVDTLKIDQSFIRDMLDDKGDMAIVQGIIALAKAFERQTVAEGIETKAHYLLLLDMGCELGQGYGIAKPMPASEMINWQAAYHHDSPMVSHEVRVTGSLLIEPIKGS